MTKMLFILNDAPYGSERSYELARLAHQAGVIIHTDAAQSLGEVPLSVNELSESLHMGEAFPPDLLVAASHQSPWIGSSRADSK